MASIKTLKEFYQAMEQTIVPRRSIMNAVLNQKTPSADDVAFLEQTLNNLQSCTGGEGYKASLLLDESRSIQIDLYYEIEELKKDLLYIREGEQAFLAFLNTLHEDFDKQVNHVVETLKTISFKSFITDRDGTINNYCGRYASSVQSVYNAVFVTRFAKTLDNACILTSAPLANIGLKDISVCPEEDFILAGSKGREYINKGKKGQFPIPLEQQSKLDEFNEKLTLLIDKPQHQMFGLIGSGLQFKFGQTAIARQDISNSIPEEQSLAFLETVEGLVQDIDPNGQFFRIEDTGKDIEIILTVDSGNESKDFDKGDGVNFLNDDLSLALDKGPALICGDTFSDMPMVPAAQQLTATYSIFVTTDDALKEKVRGHLSNALFVDTPDMLATALNALAV